MAIYKRANRKGGFEYQVVVDYDPTATGVRRRRIVGTFATKKEAQRHEREAKAEHDRGIGIPTKCLTLAELAKRFLAAVAPDLAGQTASRYEEHLRMHILPSIGAIQAVKLKPMHLAVLYASLRSEKICYRKQKRRADGSEYENVRYGKPLGATTVLRIHRLMHRLLAWAEKLELIQRNVARLVDAPRAAASPARALSDDQVAAFLSASQESEHYVFFVVAAATGMRRGEIGALVWDALDLERGTAVVRQAIGQDRKGNRFIKPPKNERTRLVPLDALRRHRAHQNAMKLRDRKSYTDQGLVFADKEGGMLDLDAVSKAFSAIARAIGIKTKGVSLHSLRHFAATQALVGGSDARNVAGLLGHADASMVLRVYGHVVASAQERAVASIGDSIRAAQARRVAGQK